jgi:hypothetical protein
LRPSAAVTTINFQGFNGGILVRDIPVQVTTLEDNQWVHACFNWTGRGGVEQPIDRLVILLPDCSARRCDGKYFEVDDVWVNPKQ